MKLRTAVLLAVMTSTPVAAQELAIPVSDLLIEQGRDGGYHLWIRQLPGVGSVLLTESTADPDRKEAVYALRSPVWNSVNGDEKRMLDSEFLDTSRGLYSLIDSTPEPHPTLGAAFRIYIPYVVVYGYPWSRSGEIQVLDGTFLNIRAFARPYGDYSGGFRDNPFVLRVVQRPLEGPPEGNFMEDTVTAYREIAAESGGTAVLSIGEADIVAKIEELAGTSPGKTLDLVLALDTTASMKNDMPHIRELLIPALKRITDRYRSFRFGLVLYKDYFEQYVTRTFPFQPDLDYAQRIIDGITVFGGRDIPEAVHEALYAAVTEFPWAAERKMVILVGDAPPHPKPRGRVTKEMVYADAKERGVELHTIILPQ